MPSPAVLKNFLAAILLAACSPGKGGTDSDTSTGDASTTASTTASAADNGATATDAPPDTTAVSEVSNITGISTVATDTGPATTGPAECTDSPPPCAACDVGCFVLECVDGTWACGCEPCDTTGTDDTGAGTTASETTGGAVMCNGDPPQFPEFDRTCAVDGDCAIVFHQLDCCGSFAAWGLNADAAKPFAEAEELCEAQLPECDCVAEPTVADDGSSGDNASILVACDGGTCGTFIP